MKKTHLLVSIMFLLMLLPLSGVFASNKKPKLNLTKAKTSFSTNIPSLHSGAFVRGTAQAPETVKEFNDMYAQIYITPHPAKVFNAEPLFEWKDPVCSEASPCSINIKDSLTESIIQEIKDIKQNSFLLDYNKLLLEAGNSYLFTVKSDVKSDKLDLPIEFYILSNKEKQDLNAKLNQLKETNNPLDISDELNFYIDEGLWFDLIGSLNKAILKNPENKDLIECKDDIYQVNK